MNVFDILSVPVATVLKAIHTALSSFLAPSSGPAWGLSIVLLTICVRLVLFPLFVKQIKSQRRMQELAPRIKEVQARHKGDRETMNTELMKLYKDNNANPVAGCLPLILQLPVFFALFRTIREFKPDSAGEFHPKYGLSAELLKQGSHAKIFGAPISAAFNSSSDLLRSLNGHAGNVKLVAAAMIVIMGASTFYTQRQMMARNAPGDPQQAQVQKVLLYVLPLSFAFFGFSFPIGVLLYWLTTNLWSMGQQAYVIKRMPPAVAGGAPGGGTPNGGRGPGGKGPSGGTGPPAGSPPARPGRGSRALTRPAADTSAEPVVAGGKVPSGSGNAGGGGGGGSKDGTPDRTAAVITASPSRGRRPDGEPPDAGTGPTTAAPSGRAAGSRKNKAARRGGRR